MKILRFEMRPSSSSGSFKCLNILVNNKVKQKPIEQIMNPAMHAASQQFRPHILHCLTTGGGTGLGHMSTQSEQPQAAALKNGKSTPFEHKLIVVFIGVMCIVLFVRLE